MNIQISTIAIRPLFFLSAIHNYFLIIAAASFIYIISSGISICKASSFPLDTKKLINSIIQPVYNNLFLPKDQASGRNYSTSSGSIRYPYIALDNSIPKDAISPLEEYFATIGYHSIGKNTHFKVEGKLIASCDIRTTHSKYSNSNFNVYKSTSECNLKDFENNFIVYTGQGITYGNDKESLRIKSTILAFLSMGKNSLQHSYPVSIEGFDNGIKSSRQSDYAEAVLNAKKQAIERAGVRLNITKKHGRTYHYKNGKNSIEKYSKSEIESYASGILAPGYTIQDHGYGRDGTYRITLKGKILQDPATALKNHTEDLPRENGNSMPKPSDLLRSSIVQDIFEYKKNNLLFDIGHPSGTITIQIIRTFRSRSREDCRTARTTFSWRSEISNFTACRDPHKRRWHLTN